ncbi:MAG TPA: hypothetical protein VEU51_01870 [Candidatus Acidoferrales bacterium]|nr:hypothetical protein [Candidatus Acidoferrales bacterium]
MNSASHPSRQSIAALLVAVFVAQSFPRSAFAQQTGAAVGQNLLQNGDFAKGSVDQPDEWRTEAWINKPEAFQAHWTAAPEGHVLEVDNLQPNDGRWMQPVSLRAGWYKFSVEVRTENVGGKESGATISVMEDGVMSPEVHGTTDWQQVAMYLEVGEHGADVDVALRVGGFGSLNTGRAFFRHAMLVPIAAPPPSATPTYDLAAIRQEAAPVPIGSPWSLLVTFIALTALAIYGWRIYGGDDVRLWPRRTAAKPAGKARR